MGVPNGDLQDLERQRLELEGNILELQKSLYRWRTQEAEYDGLKEEFGELDDTATTDDFFEIGRDYDETLLSEKELAVLVEGQDANHSKERVIQLIIKRLDTVKQNVSTLEKMLRVAENKLHDLDAMERLPADPSADFPMTEIVENLDEDGNVISSSTNTPGNESADLLELLKKAGVKDVPDTPQTNTQAEASQEPQNESKSEASGSTTNDVQNAAGQTGLLTPDSVDSDDAPRTYHFEDEPATSQSAESQQERPVTNIDESPEDAQLRSEMLRYSLDEVGAVVAELELDEGASDISVDEDADVFAYDDEEESEEEDEFGRSTRSILDEDYHQQMRELEAKLNARGMWNMGKDTGSLPEEVKEELQQPRKVRIEEAPQQTDTPPAEKKPKKKVAFADELDIAPAPKPPTAEKKTLPPRQSEVQVLSDSVVERTEPVTKDPAPSTAPKKASRFKSARSSAPGNEAGDSVAPVSTAPSSSVLQRKQGTSSAPSPSSLPLFPAKPAEPKPFSQPIQDISERPRPTGPKDKILADTLVERDISEGAAAPPEPDELDEQLHRKEIASEFYRARNRRIKENEGFVDNEPEMVPIETEEAPKKVSKFRAARMR
ncbi:prefoldin-like protein [Aspergillus melleus]|uniref:prefoldin-like protein n=1 Tax=Aspergillus melleus TaxID=138277 RepID=UPI001E8DECD0|nr:uncharacterized protein LDX57_006201 [Aspergillus melleus]KAH8428504.1 hypothetical protein LDX57_006201 [Aspergillus melleus]